MQDKNLYTKLIFTVFCLVHSLFASAQCLPAWQYYVPLTVKNNTSDMLQNYQFKIVLNTQSLISAGKMHSTGDDIRFVDSASCTPMPYYIESGINTTSTVVWVKLPRLTANATKTIRMYYGNKNAAAQSNGDSTFLIFDDFDGTGLNTDKWTSHGSNNTYTVSGGKLTATATYAFGGSSAVILSKSSFSSPITVESNVTDYNGYYPSIAILDSGAFYGYTLFYGDYTISTGSMYQGRAYSNSGSYASNQTDTNNSPGTITGLWQLSVSSTGEQISSWPSGEFRQNTFTTPNTVQVAAGTLFTSDGAMTMDWLRARTYASTDATANIGSESSNINSIALNLQPEYLINIYPNPAKNILTIDLDSQTGIFDKLELIDMNGKVINTFELHGNIITVPVNQLPNGFYQIRVSGKRALVTKKVLIN